MATLGDLIAGAINGALTASRAQDDTETLAQVQKSIVRALGGVPGGVQEPGAGQSGGGGR